MTENREPITDLTLEEVARERAYAMMLDRDEVRTFIAYMSGWTASGVQSALSLIERDRENQAMLDSWTGRSSRSSPGRR